MGNGFDENSRFNINRKRYEQNYEFIFKNGSKISIDKNKQFEKLRGYKMKEKKTYLNENTQCHLSEDHKQLVIFDDEDLIKLEEKAIEKLKNFLDETKLEGK